MATPNLVSGECNVCETLLCISTNDWGRISEKYSTCDNTALFSFPGLEQFGQTVLGTRELEGCTLSSLRCRECRNIKGAVCVGTPPAKVHLLYVYSPFVSLLQV